MLHELCTIVRTIVGDQGHVARLEILVIRAPDLPFPVIRAPDLTFTLPFLHDALAIS